MKKDIFSVFELSSQFIREFPIETVVNFDEFLIIIRTILLSMYNRTDIL